MRQRRFTQNITWVLTCLLVAAVLISPGAIKANQAQYFYDVLGWLVGVVDGQSNIAAYQLGMGFGLES